MNGVTRCLGGLVETTHATMDSDVPDGRFKYPSILFSIIINIISNM